MPLTQHYEAIEAWACESGCQMVCTAVGVSASPGFLRIHYRCPTCRSKCMRYYDLEQRCYVVTGGQPDHSRNVTRFAGARPCAGQSHCVRIDATRYGDASDGVHVAKLGRSVAGKCSGLAAGELQQCFVRLVSITPQSGLFVQFQAAYEREIRK